MGRTIQYEYFDAGYYYVVIEWGSVSPGRIFLYDGNTYIAQKTVEICSNFIEVAIESILFCYGSSGSLDIRKDADENIPLPEFIAGEKNEPFAYIKSQQNRKIKVKFSSEDASTMTLKRDPSAGTSYSGTWGNYEDYFFSQYMYYLSGNPYWVNNQSGQSVGCEAPTHRLYQVYPTAAILYDWLGPDR